MSANPALVHVTLSNPASVIRFVFDEYANKILGATSHHAMSASELSWRLKVPIAESYRRCLQLEELGLLARDGTTLSKN